MNSANKATQYFINLYASGSEDHRQGVAAAMALLELDGENFAAVIQAWHLHQCSTVNADVMLDNCLQRKYLVPAAEKFVSKFLRRKADTLALLLGAPGPEDGLPTEYSSHREMYTDQLLRNMGYLNYVKD